MSPVAAPADGASAARTSSRRASAAGGARSSSRCWRWRASSPALALRRLPRRRSSSPHAHVLRIDRIVVRGNERLSDGEVLAVLSGLRGENLMWTDLDAWRRRLLASPWVRDAALRRSLPSTVEVMVSERQPIGIGRIDGELYLVDERGVIIDQYGPQYADFDLPIVDGLAARAGDGGSMTDEARAELAARLIAALQGEAGDRAAGCRRST